MGQIDIFAIANQGWLEQDLMVTRDTEVEQAIQAAWSNETWWMRGYPRHALALLLREYAYGSLGTFPETERRLRRLIPMLSSQGDGHQVVTGMVLLALICLDSTGYSAEVEAMAAHAMAEIDGREQGVATILTLLLGMRVASMQGRMEEAWTHAAHLLSIPLSSADPWVGSALGLAYWKMAPLVWREEHAMQTPWRHTVLSWLSFTAPSPFKTEISHLYQGLLEGIPSSQHPLVAWVHQRTLDEPANVCASLEDAVMQALLRCGGTPDTVQALHLARQLGEPFWIHHASTRLDSPDATPIAAAPTSLATSAVATETTRTQAPDLHFTFFTRFQGTVSGIGAPVFPARFRRRKVKLMFALLLLQPHYRMVRDVLVQHLFNDEDDPAVNNYLHVTIHRARQLLMQQTGVEVDWLMMRDGVIELNPQWIGAVDVETYRKQASVGHQLWSTDRQAAVDLYAQAVQLYRPAVAPEFEYEEFMVSLRGELEATQQRMLHRLSDHARTQGDLEASVHWDEQRFQLDPWDTDLLRQLCLHWAQIGETGRIRHAVGETVDRLRREGETIPEWMVRYSQSGGIRV